jgi:hypothetical protein
MADPSGSSRVDDEHALVIGRIALLFGDLELATFFFLSPLIDADAWVGPYIVGGQTISWQLEKIRQLAPRRLDAETAARTLAWASAVRSASERRNRIMHNPWLQNEDRLRKLGFTRGGLQDDHEATFDELVAFRVELADLLEEGFELIRRAADAVWPRADGKPRD